MNLFEKFLAITSEAQAIDKKGWNAFNKYKYVQATDVIAEVQKLLVKHKVSLNITESGLNREVVEGKKGNNFHSTLTCVATFTNAEKPDEKEEVKYYAVASDVLDKDIYKAKTNGLKYLLTQKFMIVTDLTIDVENGKNDNNKSNEKQLKNKGSHDVYGLCSKCNGHMYLAKGKLFCQNWKDKTVHKEHDVADFTGQLVVPKIIVKEGLRNIKNWISLPMEQKGEEK